MTREERDQYEISLCGDLITRMLAEDVSKDMEALDLQDHLTVVRYLDEAIEKNWPGVDEQGLNILRGEMKLRRAEIVEKLADIEVLYVLESDVTGIPYLLGDDCLVFSKEEYAKEAQDYLMQQYYETSVREVENDDVAQYLIDAFYLNGALGMIIDYGQNWFREEAGFFLRDMYEEQPEAVRNPGFVRALSKLRVEMASFLNYAGKKEKLRALEDDMIREFASSRFLIPIKRGEFPGPDVKVDKITDTLTLSFGLVRGENGHAAPLFTDAVRFKERFDPDEWDCEIMEAKDITFVPVFPAVINPGTLDFAMSRDFVKQILKFSGLEP